LEIRDYWRVLSKRWWVVVVISVVATVSSIGYSRLETPIFRSSIRLDVSPARFDYGLTMVIENLLRQYAQQLQTDKMAELVDAQLKLDLPADRLRSRVKVSPVPEDYAIQIEVDDTDPNRAKDIASAWADQFVKLHQQRMAPIDARDRIEVTVHDNARPGDLNRPKTRQNAMAAAVLGLVVGMIAIFLLEYFDDTFKTTEDVERYVLLPVLGAVPTVGARQKKYYGTRQNPSRVLEEG
jgi:capsular polysaccharide biosynthesis protein